MKKRVVLSETQLRNVVTESVKRILNELQYTEKKQSESKSKFDECIRVKGGMYLCKKNGKWCLFDKNFNKRGDWCSSKEDAKNGYEC